MGRSLKLIAPFTTLSDALMMIISLTTHTDFSVITIQNHLKASPKSKALIKHTGAQVWASIYHLSTRKIRLILTFSLVVVKVKFDIIYTVERLYSSVRNVFLS